MGDQTGSPAMMSAPGVPWNEQIGRILMGIAIADKNPAGLIEYGDYLKKYDAAKMDQLSDPTVQDYLGAPGGAGMLKQLDPSIRLPEPRPIEQLIGANPEDRMRAYNTIAAPSAPGDPTTAAYNLPLTPSQLAAKELTRAASNPRDPRYKQGFKTQVNQRTGQVTVLPSLDERDQDLHTAEEILSDPFLSQQYHSKQITPTLVGVGPNHQQLFAVTPNKATEQGEGKYQSGLADIQLRTGQPYDPTAGPGQGTDALDLKKKEQQDLATLRLKDPNAVTGGTGDLGLSPTYPGSEAAHAAIVRKTNALKLAQKQAADITAAVTKATSDEEFISGVLKPIEQLIPELPDKQYRGVGGALTSAGRKVERAAGTFFETDTLGLRANVLANTIVTNVGRRFGEKGVFTDQDAARFLKGLDVAASSQESAQLKVDALKTLMHEISERARAVAEGRGFTPPSGSRIISGDEFLAQVHGALGDAGGAAPAPNAPPTPGGMSDTERKLRERLGGR